MAQKKNLSDELYLFEVKQEENSHEKGTDARDQRKRLITALKLSVGVENLVSENDDDSFSYHGSTYKGTEVPGENDIDVYVVLNGKGLSWDDSLRELVDAREPSSGVSSDKVFPLCGVGEPLRPFERKNPREAIKWMLGKVHSTVQGGGYTHAPSRKETSHGVCIQNEMSSKSRNFDVIPAFLYKKDGSRFHVIPNKSGGWVSCATEIDKAEIKALDKRFQSDTESKRLGYSQLVRLVKRISRHREQKWRTMYNVNSFMLEHIVKDALVKDATNYLNQNIIASVVERINYAIGNGHYTNSTSGEIHPLFGHHSRPKVTAKFLQENFTLS